MDRCGFAFRASLVLILLSLASVHARHVDHTLKRRQTGSNYNHLPTHYTIPQGNNRPSSGNLYPRLDNLNPPYNPYIDFSNYQVDPGFSPHHWPNLNGRNATYVPNFNFGNPGSVNPGGVRPINGRNFSNVWNNQQNNRYPNTNFPNFNGNNPYYDNQLPGGLVSENSLPTPRTTCGKTLCSYVPSYPTKEIGQAVDRARQTLRSGAVSSSFRSRGLSLENFNSKKQTTWMGSNTSSGNRGTSVANACQSNSNAIYPHEGASSDDGNAYYVVNIPTLDQLVTNDECDSRNGLTCGPRGGLSTMETRTCQQLYRKEKLLALPVKRYFDVDDFQLRTFHVPAGCSCLPSRRAY